MELKTLSKQYNFDLAEFTEYLSSHNYPITKASLFRGAEIDDSYISKAVSSFKQFLSEEEERKAKEKAEEEEAKREAEEEAKLEAARKKNTMAQMLITSGFNFDGYTIKKYSGYISGDDVIQIDRGRGGIFFDGATNVGDALSASLVQIRRNALNELKEAAYDLGCNAVIGVDFDYITLDPETVGSNGGTLYLPYVFCVTANGNAVIIEKD